MVGGGGTEETSVSLGLREQRGKLEGKKKKTWTRDQNPAGSQELWEGPFGAWVPTFGEELPERI